MWYCRADVWFLTQYRGSTRTGVCHRPFFFQTFVYAVGMSTLSTPAAGTSAFHDRLNLAVGDTSYRQLGSMTDTHPETVRRYMQGQAPSAAFLTNLCQSLGVSGEWLLSGQGPMKVREMRKHALKNADANELMGAIANTLTMLIERVDRLDRFVQMLETKLNAGGAGTVQMVEVKPGSDTMSSQNDGSDDERSGTESRADDELGGIGGRSAERVAGAIAQRSSEVDA